jgi:hypothetical protein
MTPSRMETCDFFMLGPEKCSTWLDNKYHNLENKNHNVVFKFISLIITVSRSPYRLISQRHDFNLLGRLMKEVFQKVPITTDLNLAASCDFK